MSEPIEGDLRCRAPRPNGRGSCNHFVTRAPAGIRYRLLGLVAHSTLADPGNPIFACPSCGFFHEVRQEPMVKRDHLRNVA